MNKNQESRMFLFGESKHQHAKGDKHCLGCRWDYPEECSCGGLIHIEYLDDIPKRAPMTDTDTIFLKYCDKCETSH